MSLKLLVDMSLCPEWVGELSQAGWPAVHWSAVGNATADDSEIMAWALANDHVVFTHDLDFGTVVALTHASGPSVLQVRGQAVLPEDLGPVVLAALRQHEKVLSSGAVVVVELSRTRVRVLPF